MDQAMVMGMPEIRCRMDGTMRRGQRTGMAGTGISCGRLRSHTGGTACTHGDTASTLAHVAGTACRRTDTLSHTGTAAHLAGDAARAATQLTSLTGSNTLGRTRRTESARAAAGICAS